MQTGGCVFVFFSLLGTDQLRTDNSHMANLSGPQFWQHFVTIARSDSKHLPTLLAFTFSGMATVHRHIAEDELGPRTQVLNYRTLWN